MSEQPASAAANGASPKPNSPSDAAAAGTSGKGSDAVPPSASLPARPVLQGLKRWGVDMQWPHATPEEIIAAGGGFTAGGITKCVWKLVLVTFFLSIYGTVDGDMFKPFLFSRVHCCAAAEPFLGTEYDAAASAAAALDGSYNLTTAAAIDHYFGHGSYAGGLTNVDACSVPEKDRDSTYWSGSTHCTNKAYVQQQAQSLNGIYSALRTYGTMLVLPVGGHPRRLLGAEEGVLSDRNLVNRDHADVLLRHHPSGRGPARPELLLLGSADPRVSRAERCGTRHAFCAILR
eukprot:COSAG06_NODE_853_length_11950_cov_3.644249_12_plen_289_part_00